MRRFIRRIRRRYQEWYDNHTVLGLEYLTRYLFSFTMTEPGKIVLGIIILASPMTMYSLEIPVYQIVIALGIFLMVCRFTNWWECPKIHLSGGVPEKVTAGVPLNVEYMVRSDSKPVRDGDMEFGDFSLGINFIPFRFGRVPFKVEPATDTEQVGWKRGDAGRPGVMRVLSPESFIDIPRGGSGALGVRMMFTRRGMYESPDPSVYSVFPFNMFRSRARVKSRTHSSSTVMALPSFHVAEGIQIPPSRNYQPGGISLTSDIGESPEYIGSRLFREGDNVRRLDFRGWARHGEPVARKFQEEYYCRVALIMDTHQPDKESQEVLEAAIQLSASIADALSNGEYIIDLFAAGPELYVFRSGRHTAHFENILEMLACLEGNPNDTFDEFGPSLRNEVENISTALFVFTDWTESRERLVRMALESGCNAKAYVVCDGDTMLPVAGLEDLVPATMVFRPEEIRDGGIGVL